jgi:hypothetical protein
MSDTCSQSVFLSVNYGREYPVCFWYENGLHHCVIKCEVDPKVLRSKERVAPRYIIQFGPNMGANDNDGGAEEPLYAILVKPVFCLLSGVHTCHAIKLEFC